MSASFQPVSWACSTNIYEVNVRQYTPEGTFAAFSRELPRLRDMGIEVLWFMPVTPISVKERKGTLGSYYACSDYGTTNPEFGTEEDFKRLVEAAHGLGFKVLIDWVANHTGWDHRWTREHPEYYRKNHEGNFFEAHGWEDVIDLNYDNQALRSAMIDVMRSWVERFDLDGFRCDMAMLVPLDFWRQAREALDEPKKLFWLAECEEIAYHEVFDATYTWKFLHRMEAVWRREFGLSGLDEVLNYYAGAFPADGLRAFFTSNHDENSHSGSEYERMGDAALGFAVLCALWNGLPLIYSGQELPNRKRLLFFDKDCIPWTGEYTLHSFYKTLLGLRKRNPALRAADKEGKTWRLDAGLVTGGGAGAVVASEGGAGPGGSPAQGGSSGAGGYGNSGEGGTGTGTDGATVQGRGSGAGGVSANDRAFVFLRQHPEGEVLVALNFSGEPLTIRLDDPVIGGSFIEAFSGETIDLTTYKTIGLPAWGYKVLEKGRG